MTLSPFHAMHIARVLSSYASGRDKLIAAYAASNIEIYPYQVAAALFALRSPYLKGCILCDDGSLGKSIEAMLVITQAWYEGKERIIIVIPTPLLGQWIEIIENHFSVPFYAIDSNAEWNEQLENGKRNPFEQDSIVLTTYDFAAEKAEYVSKISWHIVVFEEAHHLRRIYTGENKTASVIREAVGDAYKLLLTATPMQNSIMDLYGLITFIDEDALGDADEFYKRYFRKPENYGELSATASRYCFRTLRTQVESYVPIPQRIIITANYPLSAEEEKLAALVKDYLNKPDKPAFPKMDNYDLTLMFMRALSSSPFALAGLADRAYGRVQEPELYEMATLAADIQPKSTGKGQELLKALKRTFVELKKRGANRKAIIFTQSLSTLGFLHILLSDDYKTLAFDGSRSTDYSVIKRFESEAEILITTDVAAEGFNLEFCSFVVNYDLPYNVLTIEQRINRCHRQGQKSDVIVLNFLNPNNFADVRMLELINKRILQFDGILGLADDVIGGFSADVSQGLDRFVAAARTTAEIDKAYQETLSLHEDENKQLVSQAESLLFTTFNKEISDSVTITPQYIYGKIKEINDRLWDLTKYFFGGRHQFQLDDDTRAVSCLGTPPKVFTGTAMRRNEYSMDLKYQPASGRHTITGALAKNILQETFWVGIPDRGSIIVDAPLESCTIGYYRVKVKSQADYFSAWYYDVFIGKAAGGRVLTHDECAKIMALPVASFAKEGETYGERDGITREKTPHELDGLISPDEYIRRTVTESDSAVKEEIERLRMLTQKRKISLEHDIETLRGEVKSMENSLGRASSIAEKVQAEKRKSAAKKELKQREQQLFLDGMRLDLELEEQIKGLADGAKMTAEVKRQFVINVEGK